MKRTEPMAIGDILKAMIDSEGDSLEFDRHKAAYLWGEIVGATINQATTRRFVEKDVLHVYLNSSPLKSELQYMLNSIIAKLNEAIGRKVINRIVLH